jgi:hypothetical protein
MEAAVATIKPRRVVGRSGPCMSFSITVPLVQLDVEAVLGERSDEPGFGVERLG